MDFNFNTDDINCVNMNCEVLAIGSLSEKYRYKLIDILDLE